MKEHATANRPGSYSTPLLVSAAAAVAIVAAPIAGHGRANPASGLPRRPHDDHLPAAGRPPGHPPPSPGHYLSLPNNADSSAGGCSCDSDVAGVICARSAAACPSLSAPAIPLARLTRSAANAGKLASMGAQPIVCDVSSTVRHCWAPSARSHPTSSFTSPRISLNYSRGTAGRSL